MRRVKRLLFLGSSCIYPKLAHQPMAESRLLSSALEPTNEVYVGKIAGLKMEEHDRRQYRVTYHSAMPTNLYGPEDNYHAQNFHFMLALIRHFFTRQRWLPSRRCRPWAQVAHAASSCIWMTLPDACAFLLQPETPPNLVNVGWHRCHYWSAGRPSG